MRTVSLLAWVFATALSLSAADSCTTIHGRAHFYGGDGQLRIWHIGTHHEYTPDESSWDRVLEWLNAGVSEPIRKSSAVPASMVDLFADFLICPVEPFKQGSVQRAKVMSAQRRRYVPVQ